MLLLLGQARGFCLQAMQRHAKDVVKKLTSMYLALVCTNYFVYTIIQEDLVLLVVWLFQKSNGFESPESSIQCNYVHTKTLLTWLLLKFIKVGLASQV